jgi:Catechol dioxygenase N terminus
MGGALWPEHHRYLADTLWTNSPPATVLATLRDHFMLAPSPKSQTTFVLSTGKDRDSSPLPDGAYSMTGDALMLCYAIWERPEDDVANRAWHRAMTADLDNFAVGHYVGEIGHRSRSTTRRKIVCEGKLGALAGTAEEIRLRRPLSRTFRGELIVLNRNSCSDFRSEIGAALPAPILLSITTIDSRRRNKGSAYEPHSELTMFRVKIAETPEIEEFLRVVSGLDQSGGDPRTKKIAHRIVTYLFKTIDDLDITPDEFWAAVSYINDLSASSEAGLLAAGLGLEHFLGFLRNDAVDVEKISRIRINRGIIQYLVGGGDHVGAARSACEDVVRALDVDPRAEHRAEQPELLAAQTLARFCGYADRAVIFAQ